MPPPNSVFQWPFQREVYAGLENPRFVSDIEAANQAVLDGLMNAFGFGPNDFWLVGGFQYTAGAPGTYGAGVFYLNGSWYYAAAGLSEGQALNPQLVPTMQQPFGDGNQRSIYSLQQSTPVNASTPGTTTPLFAGNMNAYRMDNKTLQGFIVAIQATIALLGAAAFMQVGQTAGTVAAGNDARFGYTVSQANALFATIVNVLTLNNTTPFTPTAPYQPATKQYVDNSSAQRLASGTTNVGDIPTGGTTVNISFGTTLANTTYQCFIVGLSLGNPVNDSTSHWPTVFNKTTTGCSVRFQEGVGVTQDLGMDWIVFGGSV